ncbi:TPA: hypothetical protein ACNH05_003810, partial [Acinetobacter baumannii]
QQPHRKVWLVLRLRKNVQIMGQISEYMMELGQQTFNDPKARDHMQEEMLKIIAPLMKDKEKS